MKIRPVWKKLGIASTIPLGILGLGILEAKYYSSSASSTAITAANDRFKYNVGNASKPDVKLYQYTVCPYCHKAKSVLSLLEVPLKSMSLVEVSPMSKKEIKFSEYKKVPFAVVNDEQVNGSDEIIEHFLAKENIQESERSKKWRTWTNEELAPLLPMNLYISVFDAFSAFDYITSQSSFSTFEKIYSKYGGGIIMKLVADRMKKKRNIEDPFKALIGCVEKFATEGLGELTEKEDIVGQYAVFGLLSVLDGNYKVWNQLREADFKNKEKFWMWYADLKLRRDKLD